MRKLVLTAVLALTLCNLALGVAFAAVCQSRGGARACGDLCEAQANGACNCLGGCTADERKWVDGAGGHAAALEEEFNY